MLLADVPEIQSIANVEIVEISNKGSGSVVVVLNETIHF